ncbi:MAG: hypothetical protein ACK4YQ_06955 [Phenylobacterium sp.]|uniref:hypothetical protein n=1 Tax=Phenylobacterium sp. TaxID=1871053 RepID=UPI00391925D3
MTAPGRIAADPPPEAVIVSAAVGPGHDGEAELIVALLHPNGARESVSLDAELGFHLMTVCGASDAAGLAGQPWRRILEGL